MYEVESQKNHFFITLVLTLGLSLGALADLYIIGNPNVYYGNENGGNTTNGDTISENDNDYEFYNDFENSERNENIADTGNNESSTYENAYASGGGVMYVTGEPFVRLRSDESTNKPYLAKMPYGSEVTVLSTNETEEGSWSCILYNKQQGYSLSKYLSEENPYQGSSATPQTKTAAFGTNLLQRGNKFSDHNVKNLQLCLYRRRILIRSSWC